MNMTLTHHPNVELIWEMWPWNVILWDPVREFIQGHGLNPALNVAGDIFRLPIFLWNTVTGIIFWWFNLAWFFLNLLPNLTIGTLSDIIFFIPEVVTFFTRIAGYVIWGLLVLVSNTITAILAIVFAVVYITI